MIQTMMRDGLIGGWRYSAYFNLLRQGYRFVENVSKERLPDIRRRIEAWGTDYVLEEAFVAKGKPPEGMRALLIRDATPPSSKNFNTRQKPR